jgi:hypothetical protein
MTKKNIIRGVGTLVAVVALAAAGFALSSATTGKSSAAADAAAPSDARASGVPGGSRPAGGPMMGTPVTGPAAAKAKAAALAKYPGTVERVMKRPSGGYEVHVIKSGGSEVHVLVNSAFKVTGVETGGPLRGMHGDGPQGGPPAAVPPQAGSNGSSPS